MALTALVVEDSAAKAIEEAAAWWRANRPAAPEALAFELDRAFQLIRMRPAIGPRALSARLPRVRRFHLSLVRYHVYYRVQGDVVVVLALWHTSRGSAPDI